MVVAGEITMRGLIHFAVLALSMALAAAAQAERRVALVIGNNAYKNLPVNAQLEKAAADSRAVRDALLKLGFEVLHEENVPLGRTKELLFEFSAKLGEDDIAFIYYAGHGVALGGANYLVPSDIPAITVPDSPSAVAAEEERLAEFAVSEEFVIRRIKATGARVGTVELTDQTRFRQERMMEWTDTSAVAPNCCGGLFASGAREGDKNRHERQDRAGESSYRARILAHSGSPVDGLAGRLQFRTACLPRRLVGR
jgi:hypothetical protein